MVHFAIVFGTDFVRQTNFLFRLKLDTTYFKMSTT